MNAPDTRQKDLPLFARYFSDNLDLTSATLFTSKNLLFGWDVCQELTCPATAIHVL